MEYISYCGLLCNECPVYIATKNNDNEMKTKLAVDYSNEYCAFEQADMNCEGCFSIKNKDNKMCGGCKIRNCAEVKNYQKNCGNCLDYPCSLIEEFCSVGCDSRARLDNISSRKQ